MSASTSIFTSVVESHLGLPAQPLADLRWVADQRRRIARAPRELLVEADVLAPVEPDMLERGSDELLDGVRLACRDDVVVRLVGLQDHPHRPHVVAGEAPVPLRREVAEPQLLLEPEADRRRAAADLAGQEVLGAAGRLVVEEDRRRGVQPVVPAEGAGEEVGERLAGAVGRDRRYRRSLVLRHLLRGAEDLSRGGVQEAAFRMLAPESVQEGAAVAAAAKVDVPTGSSQDAGTNETDARW